MAYRMFQPTTPALIALVMIAILPWGCSADAGTTESGELRQSHTAEYRLPYVLTLPAGHGDQTDQRWPLVVHLHGGAARGDDVDELLDYPPVKILARKKLPFVIVSPLCPEHEYWDRHAEAVRLLIDELIATRSVDPERVYLMGQSMGGYGTWYLAHRFPERFAAIAPIAAPGVPWWTFNLGDLPVWVFHGAKDDVVPVSNAHAMVAALEERSGQVQLTVDPEAGHLLREPFTGQALFDWFLEHSREDHRPR